MPRPKRSMTAARRSLRKNLTQELDNVEEGSQSAHSDDERAVIPKKKPSSPKSKRSTRKQSAVRRKLSPKSNATPMHKSSTNKHPTTDDASYSITSSSSSKTTLSIRKLKSTESDRKKRQNVQHDAHLHSPLKKKSRQMSDENSFGSCNNDSISFSDSDEAGQIDTKCSFDEKMKIMKNVEAEWIDTKGDVVEKDVQMSAVNEYKKFMSERFVTYSESVSIQFLGLFFTDLDVGKPNAWKINHRNIEPSRTVEIAKNSSDSALSMPIKILVTVKKTPDQITKEAPCPFKCFSGNEKKTPYDPRPRNSCVVDFKSFLLTIQGWTQRYNLATDDGCQQFYDEVIDPSNDGQVTVNYEKLIELAQKYFQLQFLVIDGQHRAYVQRQILTQKITVCKRWFFPELRNMCSFYLAKDPFEMDKVGLGSVKYLSASVTKDYALAKGFSFESMLNTISTALERNIPVFEAINFLEIKSKTIVLTYPGFMDAFKTIAKWVFDVVVDVSTDQTAGYMKFVEEKSISGGLVKECNKRRDLFLDVKTLSMIFKRGFKYNNLMLPRSVLEPTGRKARNFQASFKNERGDEELVEWHFNNQIYVLAKTFLRAESTRGSRIHFKYVMDSMSEKLSVRILEYVQYAVDTTSQSLYDLCFKKVSETTNRYKFGYMLENMLQSSLLDAVVHIVKNSGSMTANHLKQQPQFVQFLIDHCDSNVLDAYGGKMALLTKGHDEGIKYPFNLTKFQCGTKSKKPALTKKPKSLLESFLFVYPLYVTSLVKAFMVSIAPFLHRSFELLKCNDEKGDLIYKKFRGTDVKCGVFKDQDFDVFMAHFDMLDFVEIKNLPKFPFGPLATAKHVFCVNEDPKDRVLPHSSVPVQFAVHNFNVRKESESEEENGNEKSDGTIKEGQDLAEGASVQSDLSKGTGKEDDGIQVEVNSGKEIKLNANEVEDASSIENGDEESRDGINFLSNEAEVVEEEEDSGLMEESEDAYHKVDDCNLEAENTGKSVDLEETNMGGDSLTLDSKRKECFQREQSLHEVFSKKIEKAESIDELNETLLLIEKVKMMLI